MKISPSLSILFGTLATFTRALIGAYGTNTTFLMLLWIIVGEGWSWVGFFNSFAHLLWIGALILLPFSLMLAGRKPSLQWVSVAVLLPPIFAFMVIYAPRFSPKEAPVVMPDSIVLRLYTHNIAPRTDNYDGIDVLIAESDADLIALQEISDETLAHLEARWREDYPYQAIYAGIVSPHQGQAFLSRYPIVEERYWQFDWLPAPLGYQRLVLDVDGHAIVVYNVHPTHPGMGGALYDVTYRTREISALLGIVRDETHPVILMGDFNFHDTSDDYTRLNQHFTDVYREVGWGMGFTFPAMSDEPASLLSPFNAFVRPLLRLDYIFTSAGFIPLSAHVLPDSGASDHLPILAELAFRPSS